MIRLQDQTGAGDGYPSGASAQQKGGTSRHPLSAPPKPASPPRIPAPSQTPLSSLFSVFPAQPELSHRDSRRPLGRNDIYAAHMHHHRAEATPEFL